MDIIVADHQSFGVTGHDDLQSDPPGTRPPSTPAAVNTGVYFNGGFEIPSKKYIYVLDIKYIRWTRDNFTPQEAWFERGDGEFQFTFASKYAEMF